ncbi:hypothetical protein [Dactylosporangium sp. NPDC049140]|jgi:hypothetical protein|uniref:hypothetical protein n=1 Tax=Dactylosporangium sp. NPDC049140 TaxID=3155647 RepID=UPI0033DE519C
MNRPLAAVLAIQIIAHVTLPGVVTQMPGYAAPIVALQALSLVAEVAAIVFLWAPFIQERGTGSVASLQRHG